jgi:hypothetical protein
MLGKSLGPQRDEKGAEAIGRQWVSRLTKI